VVAIANAKRASAAIRHAQDEIGERYVEPVLLFEREFVAGDPRVAEALFAVLWGLSALRLIGTHDALEMRYLGIFR
jgi:hypothetical protein